LSVLDAPAPWFFCRLPRGYQRSACVSTLSNPEACASGISLGYRPFKLCSGQLIFEQFFFSPVPTAFGHFSPASPLFKAGFPLSPKPTRRSFACADFAILRARGQTVFSFPLLSTSGPFLGDFPILCGEQTSPDLLFLRRAHLIPLREQLLSPSRVHQVWLPLFFGLPDLIPHFVNTLSCSMPASCSSHIAATKLPRLRWFFPFLGSFSIRTLCRNPEVSFLRWSNTSPASGCHPERLVTAAL